jgi:hypothetical protein
MIDIKNNEINIKNRLLGGIHKRKPMAAAAAAAAQVKGLKLPNGEYLLTVSDWDGWDNVSTPVNDNVLTLFDPILYTYTYNEDTGIYEDVEDDTLYIKIVSRDNTTFIYTIEIDGVSGTMIFNSEPEPEPEPNLGLKFQDGINIWNISSKNPETTDPFSIEITVSDNGNIVRLDIEDYTYNYDNVNDKYLNADGSYIKIKNYDVNSGVYTVESHTIQGTIYLKPEELDLGLKFQDGINIWYVNSKYAVFDSFPTEITVSDNGNIARIDDVYTYNYDNVSDKYLHPDSSYIKIRNYDENSGMYIVESKSSYGTINLKSEPEPEYFYTKDGIDALKKDGLYEAALSPNVNDVVPKVILDLLFADGFTIDILLEGNWISIDKSEPESDIIIDLNEGWNLIGSSFNGTLEDPESIIIPDTLYAYDNSYVSSTEINANKGYWIKCKNSGTIKLKKN